MSDIFLLNADGAGLVRLTEAAGMNTYPAWQP
jgi:hypothetical protein